MIEEGKRQKGGNNGMPINPPPKNLRPEPKLNVLETLKKNGSMTKEELYSKISHYGEVSHLLIQGKLLYKNGVYSLPVKKSKYNNIKTVVDGYKFDSIKEANYYIGLKAMEKVGLITDLVLQPKFEICPSVRWNGKKLAARKYIADFIYWDRFLLKPVVIDVKGMRTSVYSLKRSLFLTQYPEYEFREV